MAKVRRNCEVCNKEITVKVADLNRGWGRTCSKSCAAYKREGTGGRRRRAINLKHIRREEQRTKEERRAAAREAERQRAIDNPEYRVVSPRRLSLD